MYRFYVRELSCTRYSSLSKQGVYHRRHSDRLMFTLDRSVYKVFEALLYVDDMVFCCLTFPEDNTRITRDYYTILELCGTCCAREVMAANVLIS